jgi:THO complex subunit 4
LSHDNLLFNNFHPLSISTESIMSGKLDQSLDEITSAQRKNAGRRRSTQRRSSTRAAVAAPVGGIKKTTKPARGAVSKTTPAKAIPSNAESKVIVSNLVRSVPSIITGDYVLTTCQPKDVSEQQIKVRFR